MPEHLDEPDDGAILSLGRIAWAAINLESQARKICQMILRDEEEDKRAIGKYIEKAVNEVKHYKQLPGSASLLEWLGNATVNLRVRNQIMHSTHAATLVRRADGRLAAGKEKYLLHYPIGNRSPEIKTPLKAEILEDIASTIWDVFLCGEEVGIVWAVSRRDLESSSPDPF